MNQTSQLQPLEFPARPPVAPGRVVPFLIGATVSEIERELVLQTLARCGGNRTQAALMLGMSIRTLRNKIRQYAADGIEVQGPNAGAPGRAG